MILYDSLDRSINVLAIHVEIPLQKKKILLAKKPKKQKKNPTTHNILFSSIHSIISTTNSFYLTHAKMQEYNDK